MPGRPQNRFFKELGFKLSKLNGKHVAICNLCNKPLKNTASDRLRRHRNVCNDMEKTVLPVENSIDKEEIMDGMFIDNDKTEDNLSYLQRSSYDKPDMNSIDTEELINEVFKRKPLWDSKCSEHSKRDVVKKLWDEVAEVIECDKELVKKRWKNLRDNYRMETKKHSKKIKPENIGGIRRVKWAYFDSLNFLRDVFESKPAEGDFTSSAMRTDEELNTDSTTTTEYRSTPELNYVRRVRDIKSENQTSLSTHSKSTRKRKRTFEEASEGVQREKIKLSAADNELKNDSDYYFLISCLDHLKSLSQLNNLKFRNETIRLLLELKHSEDNISNAHDILYQSSSGSLQNKSDPLQ